VSEASVNLGHQIGNAQVEQSVEVHLLAGPRVIVGQACAQTRFQLQARTARPIESAPRPSWCRKLATGSSLLWKNIAVETFTDGESHSERFGRNTPGPSGGDGSIVINIDAGVRWRRERCKTSGRPLPDSPARRRHMRPSSMPVRCNRRAVFYATRRKWQQFSSF
jgi:hypothetical protein